MPEPLRIALLIESSYSFGRRLQQGIAAYAQTYGPWVFHHEERSYDDPAPAGLKDWGPHGVIARITTPRLARQLAELGVPLVDLCDREFMQVDHRVLVDHEAVVRLAIEHLLECGLRNFAYSGFQGVSFSAHRQRLFSEYVENLGHRPHVYLPPPPESPRGLMHIATDALRHTAEFNRWIESLPKPVGIIGSNDIRAQQVLSSCAQIGIAVPDQVAVVGVDNDEVRCDLCNPSLSSVNTNAFQVGHEAAALLEGVINGHRSRPETALIEPAGIIRRRSTDVLAFADPELSELVRHIRQHACDGLTIGQLVKHSGMSRATLDRLFQRNLAHTPHAEIIRVRINRVKELLTTSDLALKQIARLSGFTHDETLYRIFKRTTGQTPSEFRKAAAHING